MGRFGEKGETKLLQDFFLEQVLEQGQATAGKEHI